MGGLRAKDADRDRFVELIEAAYVDGQLSTEDRELRVTRALSAATVDELEALTRDLQGRPAPAGVQQVASPAGPQRRSAIALVVLGLVVSVLGVGVASLVMLSTPDAEPVTQTGVEAVEQSSSAVPEPTEEPVAVEPEVAPFEMTAAQVRRFLGEYEQKFGTLDAYQAVFYPARVSLEVPVRGSRPRYERWSYDGSWDQYAEASAVRGAEIIDLGAFNVPRMFANITTAKRTLNVQRGELTHVIVQKWSLDPEPSVAIYVGNSFNEGGYLATTFSGNATLRSFPYEP
jgi:hypothetical protein